MANRNSIEMWHGLRWIQQSPFHVWASECILIHSVVARTVRSSLCQSHRKPFHANTLQFAMRNISM